MGGGGQDAEELVGVVGVQSRAANEDPTGVMEEMHILMLVAGHWVADAGEGETPSVGPSFSFYFLSLYYQRLDLVGGWVMKGWVGDGCFWVFWGRWVQIPEPILVALQQLSDPQSNPLTALSR